MSVVRSLATEGADRAQPELYQENELSVTDYTAVNKLLGVDLAIIPTQLDQALPNLIRLPEALEYWQKHVLNIGVALDNLHLVPYLGLAEHREVRVCL